MLSGGIATEGTKVTKGNVRSLIFAPTIRTGVWVVKGESDIDGQDGGVIEAECTSTDPRNAEIGGSMHNHAAAYLTGRESLPASGRQSACRQGEDFDSRLIVLRHSGASLSTPRDMQRR